MDIERKTIKIQLKADKPGSFSATIVTLNVIDSDRDVTLPGAFANGKEIVMSSYQHGSWQGGMDALPPGKGTVSEINNEVVVDGEFNLNTITGKEHYETLKFMSGIQEYSYGFRPIEYEFGEFNGQQVRFLKKVDIFEFSPVLKGAGVGTRTRDIKNDKGMTFADQAESALAAVSSFVERTKSLADLRRKEGRDLSDTNKERVKNILFTLSIVVSNLKGILGVAESDKAVLMAIKEKAKFYGG